jgi:hypothetical protein
MPAYYLNNFAGENNSTLLPFRFSCPFNKRIRFFQAKFTTKVIRSLSKVKKMSVDGHNRRTF